MKKLSCCIVLLILMTASFPLYGGIYSWTDENGVKHFSDTAPSQDAEDVDVIETPEYSKPSDDYNKQKSDSFSPPNQSIKDELSDDQIKEKIKKAIEEEYGIEVKDSCPNETDEEIYLAIKSTWESMLQILITGDIDRALTYFSPFSRDQMRRKISELSKEDLKASFESIYKIKIDKLYKDDGIANCSALRFSWRSPTGTFAYPVSFIKDVDCTWRVDGF